MQRTVKITISLPSELAKFVDQAAERLRRPRSQVLAEMIEERRREELRASLVEGYKAMAEDNTRFAEEAREIAIADWGDAEETW
jgi:predicted transcriptional regulator